MTLYNENFIEIGFIRKSHGYSGACKIVIEDIFIDDLKDQDFIFLDIDGYKVPFQIENLEFKRDVILKLVDLSNPDDLKGFQQSPIFLLEKDLDHASEELTKTRASENWVGYMIDDQTLGPIGRIERIEEYPQQLMAIVQGPKKNEILIPMNEHLIVEVKDRRILMDLPEGLI